MAQHDMPGQAVRGWPRRVAAAAVAAAAVVAAALAGAGPAVAKPKPPALAFTLFANQNGPFGVAVGP